MNGQTWRVQPSSPARLAVLIDGWTELAIAPPSQNMDRIDLIVERTVPAGREYMVVFGCFADVRPVTPAGWEPIATVRVPRAVMEIREHLISDVFSDNPQH